MPLRSPAMVCSASCKAKAVAPFTEGPITGCGLQASATASSSELPCAALLLPGLPRSAAAAAGSAVAACMCRCIPRVIKHCGHGVCWGQFECTCGIAPHSLQVQWVLQGARLVRLDALPACEGASIKLISEQNPSQGRTASGEGYAQDVTHAQDATQAYFIPLVNMAHGPARAMGGWPSFFQDVGPCPGNCTSCLCSVHCLSSPF